MATPADPRMIDGIARKFQRGDLAGARADCERFLATECDSRQQADARFWLGAIEARNGAWAAAAEQYEQGLAINRDDPQWLLQAGLTYFHLREFAHAEHLYRAALRINPGYALGHYNLGVLLQHKPDPLGACRAFEAAIAHRPQFPEAHTNLANTLVSLGDNERAVAHYHRAIALNPRLANAHHGLGLHHLRRQQREPASRCFETALAHDPAHLDAWLDLAECHHLAGRDDRALACVHQALARNATHATALFKRAQYSGSQPTAAPAAMIERMYAAMAGTFDEHVTQRLGYRVPALLIGELTPWLTDFARHHDRLPSVLDLGCGTGLLGVAVRPFATGLTGVDLSAAMLAKARDRGIYDRLVESDLQSFLEKLAPAPESTFDLVTATDVFIYVGKVDALFGRVAALLSPAGVFAFSIESPLQLDQDCRLDASGRFVHSTGYVGRLAEANGFDVVKRIQTVVRTENAVPLDGYVFILRKK